MKAVLAEDVSECGEFEVWLGLDLDGELADAERAALQKHLQGCERCQKEYSLLNRSRAAMRAKADLPRAPAGLVARVQHGIHDAAEQERRGKRRVMAVASAAALIILVGIVATLSSLNAGRSDSTARDVQDAASVVSASVSQHQLELPADIASADPARIEAFIRSRVGRAIDVPRLGDEGFSLRGGRVISVENRPAAQLSYQGGLGRRISVTAIPDVAEPVSDAAVKASEQLDGEQSNRERSDGEPEEPVRAVKVGSTLYTVVGDVSSDTLRNVAAHIADQSANR